MNRSTLKPYLVALGIVALGMVTMLAKPAQSIPPNKILQTPVYIQNGSTVLAAFYEDGGAKLPITTPALGRFDSLYVAGASEHDGGAQFDHTLNTLGLATLDSAYTPGLLGTDGGLRAKNSIVGPTLTDSAGAATLSGTLAVTSTITALAGARVMVATAQAAASDNSWQFYTGAVGTAITFSPAFASGTPHCFCNDLTASQFCRVTATNTTATITGTGTDAVFVGCVGIK